VFKIDKSKVTPQSKTAFWNKVHQEECAQLRNDVVEAIRQKQIELNNCKSHLAEVKASNDRLKMQKLSKDQVISEQTLALKDCRTNLSLREQDYALVDSDFQEKNEAYNALVRDCNRKIQAIITKAEECDDALAKVTKEYNANMRDFEQVSTTYRDREEKFQIIKASYENINLQYKAMVEYRKNIRAALDELNNWIRKCITERKSCQDDLETCTKNLETAKKELATLIKSFTECNAELANCRRQLEECERYRKRILEEQSKVSALLAECRLQEQACSRTLQEKATLNSELKRYLEELKKRKIGCDNDTGSYRSALGEAEVANTELQAYTEQYNILRQGYINLQQEKLKNKAEATTGCKTNVTTKFPSPPAPPPPPPPQIPLPPPPPPSAVVKFYDTDNPNDPKRTEVLTLEAKGTSTGTASAAEGTAGWQINSAIVTGDPVTISTIHKDKQEKNKTFDNVSGAKAYWDGGGGWQKVVTVKITDPTKLGDPLTNLNVDALFP